jgi:hypothetical protein
MGAVANAPLLYIPRHPQNSQTKGVPSMRVLIKKRSYFSRLIRFPKLFYNTYTYTKSLKAAWLLSYILINPFSK